MQIPCVNRRTPDEAELERAHCPDACLREGRLPNCVNAEYLKP